MTDRDAAMSEQTAVERIKARLDREAGKWVVRSQLDRILDEEVIAPAPPASADLRAALERLLAAMDGRYGIFIGGKGGGKTELAAAWKEAHAALSSTPVPSPEIDVPRLARAECVEGERDGSGPCGHHRALAERHAAAYRELQDEK